MTLYGDYEALVFQRYERTMSKPIPREWKLRAKNVWGTSKHYSVRFPECDKRAKGSYETRGNEFVAKVDASVYEYVRTNGGFVMFDGMLPDPPNTS